MLEETNSPDTTLPSVQRMPVSKTTVVARTDIAERPQKDERPAGATVIAADVVFNGELTAGKKIYIHGTVEGTIGRDTKSVIIGKQGRVKATIHATKVTVEGRVDGDIYGDKVVVLKNGAAVRGNVYCACIQIERGANFNGTVTMA